MKRMVMTLLPATFAAALSFSQAGAAVSAADAFAAVEKHEAVQLALLNLSLKTAALSAEAGWKGAQLSVAPSAAYNDKPADMALSSIELGAEIVVPTGLTEAERDKRLLAAEAVLVAESELAEAYGRSHVELVSLYAAAYAAQQAVAAAEAEAELARLRLESVTLKAARGLAAVYDVTDAASERQAASEKAMQARLDFQIAWYEFGYAAGLDAAKPDPSRMAAAEHKPFPDTPMREAPRFAAPVLAELVKTAPQPGILMAEGKAVNPALIAQRQRIEAARRELAASSRFDLALSPKLSYATPEFSLSLGYGTASGAFSLGSGWTAYENPSSLSSNSNPADHTVTLSLGISGGFNAAGTAERAALLAALRVEERRLLAVEQALELAVRTRYAAYLKSRDGLAEAKRAERSAGETAAASRTRAALGQLSPEDEAAATVLLARASYGAQRAEADLIKAYLELISSASAWNAAGIPTKRSTK